MVQSQHRHPMSHHRFFLAPEEWSDDLLQLRDEEAHHCRNVMRCQAGDRIAVFDGRGREMEAEILSLSKQAIDLNPVSAMESDPLPARITLGQAVPKGKNMDLIIQKATELGAAKVVPLLTEHTVVQVKGGDAERKRMKWQRVAVEACKQCGQNWLPQVERPVTVREFLEAAAAEFRLVAALDSRSLSLKRILGEWDRVHEDRPVSAAILIGPEGDFSSGEIDDAIAAGFQPVSLGPIVLRSETAALYSLSVLAYELMDR